MWRIMASFSPIDRAEVSAPKSRLLLGLSLALAIIGCGGPTGYSLVEQRILDTLPPKYAQHNSGIVFPLADADIQQAIQFGKADKENSGVEYAYIIKGPSDFWNGTSVYVMAHTPLFLVADHARKRAQEYKDIDQEYIAYLKELNAVRLSLTQQAVTRNYTAIPFKRELILLRDGKRIEPLSTIKPYKGSNPFDSHLTAHAQSIIDSTRKQAQAGLQQMTPELRKFVISQYKAGGMSDAQIQELLGASSAPKNAGSSTPTEIPIFGSDPVFAVSELKKPGKYEIVFRVPSSNNLIQEAISPSAKETRFEVTFDKFR